MAIKQFLYKLIYHPFLNYVFRNILFCLKSILPKSLRIPPSGIIKLKADSGILKIHTNQTSYITQLLFWDGYKNFEYSEIFELLIKRVNIFFDIGSNIGYYSLLALKANPEITIYAFEPAIGPKYYLKKNIKANCFAKNLKHIDIALSNTEEDIDFYEVSNLKYRYLKYNLAGEGNTGTKTSSRNFIKNKVKSSTLKTFVENEKTSQIDLIKLDTEGTEIDILKSGVEIIKKHQPIIICETLYNTIESELDDFFTTLNYLKFGHTRLGLKPMKSIKRSKDNGIRNCFFIPNEKLNLISEFIV